jgi:hypothetical protein
MVGRIVGRKLYNQQIKIKQPERNGKVLLQYHLIIQRGLGNTWRDWRVD